MKKILLFGLVFILFAGIVSAFTTSDLLSYLNLNEASSSTQYLDQISQTTSKGQNLAQISGINNFAINFSSTSDDYASLNLSTAKFQNSENFSVVFWFNAQGYLETNDYILGTVQNTSTFTSNYILFEENASTTGQTLTVGMSPEGSVSSTSSIFGQSKWIMIGLSFNGTGVDLYINNTKEDSHKFSSFGNLNKGGNDGSWYLGSLSPGYTTNDASGSVDEFMIFGKSLDSSEFTNLYNDGVGFFYPFIRSQYNATTDESFNNTYSRNLSYSNVEAGGLAYFEYNGTNYTANFDYQNSTLTSLNYSLTVPLVNSGTFSNFNFNWYYNINFTNGTINHQEKSTVETQRVNTYYIASQFSNLTSIEGQSVNFSFYVPSGEATISDPQIEFNNTQNYTAYGNAGSRFSRLITAPQNQSDLIVQYNSTAFFNVSLGSDSYIRSYPFDPQDSYIMSLYYCPTTSSTNTTTLNITIYNETDASILPNTTLNTYFDLWYDNESYKQNISLNFTEWGNKYDLCIFPTWANYSTNAQMTYSASGFTEKLYYLNDYALNSIQKELSLYLTEGNDLVNFQVVDTADNPISGVTIKVLSYDVGTNTAKVTEIIKSDNDGNAYGHIVLNTQFYEFILEEDNQVVLQTDPTIITSSPKKFRVTLSPDYFQNYGKVQSIESSGLSFDNDTKTFSITYSDPSAAIVNACLSITRTTINNQAEIGKICESSSAATLNLNISENVDSNSYLANAYVYLSDNQQFQLDSLSVSFDRTYQTWGTGGLFIVFLFLVFMITASLWSPMVGVVFMVVGVMFMMMMKLFTLGIGAFISFIIIAGLTLYKINK